MYYLYIKYACMYIFKKICCLLNIFIYNINYININIDMYIYVNIF